MALLRVVVDEPDRRVAELRCAEHLTHDLPRGVAGTDDDHLLAAHDEPPRRGPLGDCAREEPRAGDEREQEQEVERGDAAREREAAHRVHEGHRQVGDEAADRDAARGAPHVAGRDVAPPAAVEAGEYEDDERDRDDDEDRAVEEPVVGRRGAVVPAELEGEPPRDRDQHRVGRELPQPVAGDRDHEATRSRTAERTTSTTRSCAAGSIPGQSGSARFSRAARSVSGSEPGSQPRYASAGWRCSGVV